MRCTPVIDHMASIAVPIADPEPFVHGGTKTDEKKPRRRQLSFQWQLRPHPPLIRSGVPEGNDASAASAKTSNSRSVNNAAAIFVLAASTPALYIGERLNCALGAGYTVSSFR